MCASSFITYGYGPLIVIITGAHLPRRILYLYLRFFIFLCYSNGEGDEKSFDFSEKLNIEFSLIFESLPHSIKNTSALLSFSPRRSKLNFNLDSDPPNPT